MGHPLDLAGNSGFFAALLALAPQKFTHISSLDYDENALEYGYKVLRDSNLPVTLSLMNLMRPFLAVVDPYPRHDVAVAMAVTHHLILSRPNYDIDNIFSRIKSFAKKYVYVEFCPLGMYSDEHPETIPPVPDFYTEEWFETHFRRHFTLLHKEVLSEVEVNGKKRKHRIVFIGKIN